MTECDACIRLRCAIQSPSDTGVRTGFVGEIVRVGVGEVRKLELMFVELVRGGMALGDWKCSETMVVLRFAPAEWESGNQGRQGSRQQAGQYLT